MDSGRPLQIVSIDDEKPVLNTMEWNEILESSRIQGLPISVVSIAGKFRKGKSFILNLFIRFFHHLEKTGSTDGWLIDDGRPMTGGFAWRGGSERETTGIWMWSHPFIVTQTTGQQIVVLVMDTQGTFDNESTSKEGACIFALSTLLSSLQIYNLQSNIGEDDLQHLEFFASYGKIAGEKSGRQRSGAEKPLQNLLFLIRDWRSPREFEYGLNGGRNKVRAVLQLKPGQKPELQEVRRNIDGCFQNIDGYLMPSPGDQVCVDTGGFQGQLSAIDKSFLEELRKLASSVLSPDRLPTKGDNVTSAQLSEMAQVYIETFGSGQLPDVATVMQVTVRLQNLQACRAGEQEYRDSMETALRANPGRQGFEAAHESAQRKGLAKYDGATNFGTQQASGAVREQLLAAIEERKQEFLKEVKNAEKLKLAKEEKVRAQQRAAESAVQAQESERQAEASQAQEALATTKRAEAEAESGRLRTEAASAEVEAKQREEDLRQAAREQDEAWRLELERQKAAAAVRDEERVAELRRVNEQMADCNKAAEEAKLAAQEAETRREKDARQNKALIEQLQEAQKREAEARRQLERAMKKRKKRGGFFGGFVDFVSDIFT